MIPRKTRKYEYFNRWCVHVCLYEWRDCPVQQFKTDDREECTINVWLWWSEYVDFTWAIGSRQAPKGVSLIVKVHEVSIILYNDSRAWDEHGTAENPCRLRVCVGPPPGATDSAPDSQRFRIKKIFLSIRGGETVMVTTVYCIHTPLWMYISFWRHLKQLICSVMSAICMCTVVRIVAEHCIAATGLSQERRVPNSTIHAYRCTCSHRSPKVDAKHHGMHRCWRQRHSQPCLTTRKTRL